METVISNLDFNGCLIQLTQSDGFDTMINATEMAKPFGPNKRPAFWLRSKEAQEYIQAFENYQKSTVQNLHSTLLNENNYQKSDARFSRITPVLTIEGHFSDGTRPGTWMHRLIALEYARWLDPGFAIWCNQKIDELLRNGFTTALQEERDRYNALLPKVSYYDQVLTTSEQLYSTEQLCKDLNLGISSKSLISKLEDNGFVYRRQDGKWFLSSVFDRSGYLKTITVIDKKTSKPRNLRRWTESGKHWIWSLKKQLNLLS